MKNIRYSGIVFFLAVFLCSCSKQDAGTQADFAGQLTEAEKQGGVMTPEILWKFGRLSGSDVSPDGSSVLFSVTRYDAASNKSMNNLFVLDVATGQTSRITDGTVKHYSARWHPVNGKIVCLSPASGSMQLWEMKADGSGKTQVSDTDGDINSFSVSPDGTHVLYTMDVKIDRTPLEMHPDLPLANVRIIDDLMYRHWNDWHDYKYSHIFFAAWEDGRLGDATDIMKDEPWDAPLSPWFDDSEMCWNPDGTVIAYTCKKMKGKEYAVSTNSDIYFYDIASGETENITRGMPGYDKYPSFSPDGSKVAWQSMETPGYEADKDRLFVMDLASGKKEYLTPGFDQSAGHLVWAEDNQTIYFISGIQATYQLYSINTGSGEIRQITGGRHNYTNFHLAGDRLIGEKMAMDMATEIFSVDIASGQEKQLTQVNRNIYGQIEMGAVEKRWVTTTDNKEMLVWVIYPPGFDPGKKYPALLYCQGGPQSAVSQFFSYRWNFQMMAANDYIIVAPNRRGLPTFGSEWNEQISGDYGGQNMKDYLSAIDALKQEPFIDEDRLGAVGASYGGFSVFWLAGNHDKRFKAFIAHCGIFNFESMYAATEEMFFVNHDMEGPYWKEPTPPSYEFSPHRYVQNWDTPILIITGAYDFRIPYTESLQAFNAAQLLGVPSRLLYFPDESHFVLQPQNAILWQREFFGWLDKYLK